MNNANLKKMEIPVASFTELTVKWYDLQPIVNKKKGSENSYSCKMCTSNNKATVTTNTATYTTTFKMKYNYCFNMLALVLSISKIRENH
mgnify:CR=1 FL=1